MGILSGGIDLAAATARIQARLTELGAIGGDPNGGVTRLAYTPLEREAHELFARWARADGGHVRDRCCR